MLIFWDNINGIITRTFRLKVKQNVPIKKTRVTERTSETYML